MKLLRAFALVVAIACGVQTAQAGEMELGISNQAPDIGTQIMAFLNLWF